MFLLSAALVVFNVFVFVSGQTDVSPENPCEGIADNARVPEPGSRCQQFRTCYAGVARVAQDCPIGTLFDKDTGECEHTYNVTCGDVATRALDNNVCRGTTRAQTDAQCKKFVWCVFGRDIEFDCGEGTYYSNYKKVCVHLYGLTSEERIECGL